jgi:hypothetical protein
MPVHFSTIRIGERYDRPTLAAIWGYENYQAIRRGVVTAKDSSHIILFVTRVKQPGLPQYNDYLSGDILHWEGEEGHQNDRRVASAHLRGETIHLFYREMPRMAFEYKGPVELMELPQLETERPSRFVFRLVHDQGPADDLTIHAPEVEAAPVTEREAIQTARVGQGRFRKDLLDYWQGACAVTRLPLPDILKASHIKPWRVSSNAERLDPFNGLLLLPQYDELFDAGWISFRDDGTMLVSRVLAKTSLPLLGVQAGARLARVDLRHRPFLEYHRKIFLETKDG